MKLDFDLVPTTAWGQNIRNALGRTKWDKLRKQVLEEQGNVCATCGSSEKLQCHEVWEFDDEASIQRLNGLQASCSLCHLGSHFGLAQKLASQGHADIEAIVSHFMRVNEISLEEFQNALSEAAITFEQRCEKEWIQDFGEWKSLLVNERI